MTSQTESFVKELGIEALDDVVCLEAASFVDVWSVEQYASFIENGAGRIFGLVEHDQLVGYVAFQVVLDEAEIVNIAVKSRLRGQGRGKVLLENALMVLDQTGIAVIHLEVRPSNTSARRLYESCGFVLVGKRKQYYADTNEDALVYCRNVSKEAHKQ